MLRPVSRAATTGLFARSMATKAAAAHAAAAECIPNPAEWRAKVEQLRQRAEEGAPRMLGYPVTTNFGTGLSSLVGFHWQQGPDPYVQLPIVPYAANAREVEKAVVDFVVRLFQGTACRGYVASGGHESNRAALLTARKIYPDGIVYYSKEAHYGIPNLADELRMEGRAIEVDSKSAMDVKAFAGAIDKAKPVIVVATLGTTMSGGIDDVAALLSVLKEEGLKYYLHCDAALHGNLLPFIPEMAHINFEDLAIDSLAVSPYKGWGSPTPNSVFLVSQPRLMERSAEYVLAKEGEALYIPASSRSGLNALGAMDAFVRWGGVEGMQEEVQRRLRLTEYMVEKLNSVGWSAYANPYSPIVVIDVPPSLEFIEHWQLKMEGDKASIVVSGHVTEELVDQFADAIHRLAQEQGAAASPA